MGVISLPGRLGASFLPSAGNTIVTNTLHHPIIQQHFGVWLNLKSSETEVTTQLLNYKSTQTRENEQKRKTKPFFTT